MHKHSSPKHSNATKGRKAQPKHNYKVARSNKPHRKGTESIREFIPDMPRTWTSAINKPSSGVTFAPMWLGTISGAAASIVKRFNPNSIWQPETSGGTGATPGYADWAAFYGFYRVIEYHYSISFTNKEAFDVAVWVANSSNDPGTTTNSTIVSNPMTQWKQLSAKGGMDRAKIAHGYKLDIVCGTTSVYTADSFRSLIGANPADVSWLGIGVQSFGGNLTNGVDVEMKLLQKTIMYDYLLQTPAQLQQIRIHRKWLAAQQDSAPPPSKPLVVLGESSQQT
jgi:hypothetical protein